MNENREWNIYGLSDPRTGLLRYVGITFRGVNRRTIEHLSRARKCRRTHRDCWLFSLLQAGLMPGLSIIETGRGACWQARERHWIAHYKRFGNLVNLTDGGEGTPGLKPSPEQIANFKAKMTGRKYPPGRRPAMLGRHHTPQAVEKIRATSLGRKHTPAAREKIARAAAGRDMALCVARSVAVRTGIPLLPQHRAKIAAKTANRKAVACADTGEMFQSITAAARHLGVTETSINQSIRKGCRCKGRHFAFLPE